MSPLEITAAILSALGVWLTIRRNMLCWPVSLLASLLYGKVFLDARLYADMTLQAMFCGCILYGWHVWRTDLSHTATLRLRRLGPRGAAAGVCTTFAAAALWCFALERMTDDPTPLADAMLSGFSILGQLWTARRYPASWIVWIVVDGCYVALFIARALYPTAVLYAAFVALALHGLGNWARDTRSCT